MGRWSGNASGMPKRPGEAERKAREAQDAANEKEGDRKAKGAQAAINYRDAQRAANRANRARKSQDNTAYGKSMRQTYNESYRTHQRHANDWAKRAGELGVKGKAFGGNRKPAQTADAPGSGTNTPRTPAQQSARADAGAERAARSGYSGSTGGGGNRGGGSSGSSGSGSNGGGSVNTTSTTGLRNQTTTGSQRGAVGVKTPARPPSFSRDKANAAKNAKGLLSRAIAAYNPKAPADSSAMTGGEYKTFRENYLRTHKGANLSDQSIRALGRYLKGMGKGKALFGQPATPPADPNQPTG